MNPKLLRYIADMIEAMNTVDRKWLSQFSKDGNAHVSNIQVHWYDGVIGEIRDDLGDGYGFFPKNGAV